MTEAVIRSVLDQMKHGTATLYADANSTRAYPIPVNEYGYEHLMKIIQR